MSRPLRKLRIYIDMDHTFCDFDKSREIWKEWGTTEIEKRFPWSQPGFFRSLLPMPSALEFWEKFKDIHELWFLTRPSIQNRHSYTEKADWIHRYLGEDALHRLILSPRKDLLKGDILIDDSSLNGQPDFEGEWWQFGKNDTTDWQQIIEKLKNKA